MEKVRCWICGRTEEEVNESLGKENLEVISGNAYLLKYAKRYNGEVGGEQPPICLICDNLIKLVAAKAMHYLLKHGMNLTLDSLFREFERSEGDEGSMVTISPKK